MWFYQKSKHKQIKSNRCLAIDGSRVENLHKFSKIRTSNLEEKYFFISFFFISISKT